MYHQSVGITITCGNGKCFPPERVCARGGEAVDVTWPSVKREFVWPSLSSLLSEWAYTGYPIVPSKSDRTSGSDCVILASDSCIIK